MLSISNHDTVTFNDDLAAFARDQGIVLIPGVEVTVEGRHVLVYNADVEVDKLKTFAETKRAVGPPNSDPTRSTAASTPGKIHDRAPRWNSHETNPYPNASLCAGSRLWKISSGQYTP